jgi:hypothetical protein
MTDADENIDAEREHRRDTPGRTHPDPLNKDRITELDQTAPPDWTVSHTDEEITITRQHEPNISIDTTATQPDLVTDDSLNTCNDCGFRIETDSKYCSLCDPSHDTNGGEK